MLVDGGCGIGVRALSQSISVSSRICSFHIYDNKQKAVKSWSLVIGQLIC